MGVHHEMAITDAELQLFDRVWTEAFEDGDLAVLDDAVNEDYELHTPGLEEPIRGREAFKDYVRQYNAAFPDLSVRVVDRIVGDDAVVERHRMQATHEGEFRGVPATGRTIDLTGTIVHYLEDGVITESHSQFDSLELLEQLGLVEDPR